MANIYTNTEEMETFRTTPAQNPVDLERSQKVLVRLSSQVRRRMWLFFIVFSVLTFLTLLVIGILHYVQTDKNLKQTEKLQQQLRNCWDHFGNSKKEIQNALKQIGNILTKQSNSMEQLGTSMQHVKSSQDQMNDSLYFELNKIQQNVKIVFHMEAEHFADSVSYIGTCNGKAYVIAMQLIELLQLIISITSPIMMQVIPTAPPSHKFWTMHDYVIPTKTCLDNWIMFDDSCYFFSMDQLNWNYANSLCLSTGAHLVVINSYNEQIFLQAFTLHNIFWIGLNDNGIEGDWRWVDGTDYASTVKYWERGEPNNSKGSEKCGIIYRGVWNDENCSKDFKLICEQNVNY